MKHRIQIFEDDPRIASELKKLLERNGFEAEQVTDFENPEPQIKIFAPHIILLDINLPYYNGFYWCRKLRQGTLCPIIVISARDGDSDQVMALENGADDYITKPFNHEVVLAKIRSQIRRCYGEYVSDNRSAILEKEGLSVDFTRMLLSYGASSQPLSSKEMSLMKALLEQYPSPSSRDLLLESVWDDKSFVDENTLNVNIARLRKKLEELGLKDSIETVRGMGYRLVISK